MKDEFLESARREVDALTPGSEPIGSPKAPPPASQASMLAGAMRAAGFVANPTTLEWRHPDGRVLTVEELLLRC